MIGSGALPAASAAAGDIDLLFFSMVAITGLTALAITVTIVWFVIRYRRGATLSGTDVPAPQRALEITWITATLLAFIALFFWAAVLYAGFYRSAPGAQTIYVVGKQWMWQVQHENGRREINELHLPLGEPVRLVLTTQDVIHSFFVPAFRVKQDAVPGRYTSVSFTPTALGEFRLHCAEYCGTHHARMGGRIVVLQPAAWRRWLASGSPVPGLAARGFELFRRHGCSGCHSPRGSVQAPRLQGLYGQPVQLAGGRTIVADEAYLRDSILRPGRDIVAGYRDDMPSFQGILGEDELMALIAFMKQPAQERP